MQLVSVIIPTFNRAGLVQRAIQSVRNQTYRKLEIIVVDDASSDNTRDVLSCIDDDRIKYIRHDFNRGGSATRNTGIRVATGDYIAFLDDDDEWEPSKTEEQLNMLKNYDAVLCTATWNEGQSQGHSSKKTIDPEDLRKGHFTAGGTGVMMVRSDVIKEIMFDEELPRGQDWDVFIRIAKKYRVGYLNRPLVRYNHGNHPRITNANGTLNMSGTELVKRMQILEKHKAFFGPRWFKRHMSRFLLAKVKYRTDKWRHLLFTVRKCGIAAVVWTLSKRIYRRLVENSLRRPSVNE